MFDRRAALQGLAASAAAAAFALPAPAAPPSARKPPRLRPGDTVGLVEPAGFTDDAFDLQIVLETAPASGIGETFV